METVAAPQPGRNHLGATLVPMARDDTVVFSVRMPRELHQQLHEVAKADDSSVNRTLIVAARQYVRRWEGRQQRSAGGAESR
jgi:hypothetical protein